MKRYQRSELFYKIAKIGAVNRMIAARRMKSTWEFMLSPQEAEAGERSAEEMRRIVSAACAKWSKRCKKLGESAERMLDNSP
ncbi:MAG: hypothetical protein IJQ02_12060, partial [Oscillospiraceae bacterium]|nr:hypothetical protein [Oscillospiraceae bacterium]